jgi:hypothetical protein
MGELIITVTQVTKEGERYRHNYYWNPESLTITRRSTTADDGERLVWSTLLDRKGVESFLGQYDKGYGPTVTDAITKIRRALRINDITDP